jgi:protein TonB
MPPRLLLALALSLAAHGALLVPDLGKRLAPPPPALQALLRPPIERPVEPVEPLLKNTIDSETAPRAEKPLPAPESKARGSQKREVQSAQRKLSQHLFYPAEAVSRGIEGDVRLLVRLDAAGAIIDVSVAATSGHAILDNAAIRAAYAMGKLGAGEARELIVPVIFRLQ